MTYARTDARIQESAAFVSGTRLELPQGTRRGRSCCKDVEQLDRAAGRCSWTDVVPTCRGSSKGVHKHGCSHPAAGGAVGAVVPLLLLTNGRHLQHSHKPRAHARINASRLLIESSNTSRQVDSARTVNNRHASYVNRHTSYVNNRHSSSYTTVTANVLVTATSCDMHDVMFLSVRCVNSALPQHARVGKACVVTLLCATHALSPAQACSTLGVRLSRRIRWPHPLASLPTLPSLQTCISSCRRRHSRAATIFWSEETGRAWAPCSLSPLRLSPRCPCPVHPRRGRRRGQGDEGGVNRLACDQAGVRGSPDAPCASPQNKT